MADVPMSKVIALADAYKRAPRGSGAEIESLALLCNHVEAMVLLAASERRPENPMAEYIRRVRQVVDECRKAAAGL